MGAPEATGVHIPRPVAVLDAELNSPEEVEECVEDGECVLLEVVDPIEEMGEDVEDPE